MLKMTKRFPNLRIRVDELNPPDIEAQLQSGSLDLGLIDEWTGPEKLEYERLADAPLRLVIHPDRKDLRERGCVGSVDELVGETFGVMRPNLPARVAADRFFEDQGFTAKVRIGVEANSVATLLALVRSIPSLVAVLPVAGAGLDNLRGLPLLPLPGIVPAIPTYTIWRASPGMANPATEAAMKFRVELAEYVGKFPKPPKPGEASR
jgi:DNA-binding transcriptional LysR family regulator